MRTWQLVPHISVPYLAVDIPDKLAAAFRKGEPDELVELLKMKSENEKGESAVSLMMPSAIREAAQTVFNVVTVPFDPFKPNRYIILDKDGGIVPAVVVVVLGAVFVAIPLILQQL